MKTKPFLLASLLMLLTLPLLSQTQSGYVRTTGRPDNKDGKRISGVEIRFSGKHNAVVTNRKGAFNVNLGGGQTSYVINSVLCDGYELQEKELLGRPEPVSETVQKEIVMVSLKEKRAIEENVRKQVEQKYQQKLSSLQKQLRDKTISEEKYKSELKRLNDEYDLRDRLVHDMVERYANTDYAKLNAKEAEINAFIERGELERADSVINSLNISQLERDRTSLLQDISAKERQISAERASVKSIDSTLWMAYRGKADIFFADFQNDSAIFYLEKLLTLDTTNVELMIEIGSYYDYYLTDKERALYYLKRAKSLLNNDTTSSMMVICLNDMGTCYMNYEVVDSAKICLDEALRLAKMQEDKDREALALSNLINYYGYVADRENQKRCIDESLTIFLSLYGENNEYVLSTYGKLGTYYHDLGNYRKALEMQQKALSVMPITREIYDRVSYCYNNLGHAYYGLGVLDSAEYYYKKALELAKTVYGENHPSVAAHIGNISILYNSKGQFDEALRLRRKALAINKNFFKDYNKAIATEYCNISTIFNYIDQKDSSFYYALQAARILNYIDTLSPDLIVVYSNVGGEYMDRGDLNTALDYFIKADRLAELHPKENRAGAASLYLEIGNLFCKAGMNARALQYYNKSLEIMNELYTEDNFHYFVLLHNIGSLYMEVEDMENAFIYHRRADRILRANNLMETKYAASNAKSFGVGYFNLMKYDSALVYLRESYRLFRKFSGDTSLKMLPILNDLTQTYYRLPDYDSTLVYAQKQMDILNAHSLANEPDYWGVSTIINMCLHTQHKLDECAQFMADKTFVVDIVPEGELAKRGYTGTYYILEWKEWNVNDSLNFAEAFGAPISPYNILLYKDGKTFRETLDGKAGTNGHLLIVGRETKQEILKAYNTK